MTASRPLQHYRANEHPGPKPSTSKAKLPGRSLSHFLRKLSVTPWSQTISSKVALGLITNTPKVPFKPLITSLTLCLSLPAHAIESDAYFNFPQESGHDLRTTDEMSNADANSLQLGAPALSETQDNGLFYNHLKHALKNQRYALPIDAVQHLREWLVLVDRHRFKSVPAKLKVVNDYFNAMTYVSDKDQWQQEDYWATPIEVIARHQGDCEDFAIAKYFTLRAMGVEPSHLGISYVKSYRLASAHMVLEYYEKMESTPVTLDNVVKDIRLRPDLSALYSFNEDRVWASRNPTQQVGSPADIHHWANLQLKFLQQLQL